MIDNAISMIDNAISLRITPGRRKRDDTRGTRAEE